MTAPQRKTVRLIDTHCHLDFGSFDADRDAVVERALAAGVTRIIVPALEPENWQAVLALADRYPAVYAAIGVHPNHAARWDEAYVKDIEVLAQHEKVVAIGEIGLDYYWDKVPRVVQQRAFAAQLSLAAALSLPVIVHNREADEDVLRLLRNAPQVDRPGPGVLHSFSAGPGVADLAVALGFYIGFTGPITYKRAETMRSVARQVPAERILIETDAPFLPPQLHRGERNEPAFVALVAEELAMVRKRPLTDVAEQTTANAWRLFTRL